jgi:methylmalonyl-CoA mutase
MTNQSKTGKLLEDFAPTTKEEWIKESLKYLKEKDINLLTTQTYEGITLQPFYAVEDQVESGLSIDDFARQGAWLNCEEIMVKDESSAQNLIKEALSKGSNALWLVIPEDFTSNLQALLQNVDTTKTQVNFRLAGNISSLITQTENLDFQGNIYYSFLEDWTINGQIADNAWDNLAKLFTLTQKKTNVSVIAVNTQNFVNAGGNAVQELAFGLALAVEYVDKLTEKGLPKEQVFQQVNFSMAMGTHYFMEIAKFRALRLLWKQIQEAFQVNPSALKIHARTNTWNKTAADRYNNMLRATTEAMSAVLGGVDSLTVAPFDELLGESDDFSRRIARNVSTILQEESHLDKTLDVASGSFYLEDITVALAEKAWELFQQTETKGGFIKAFEQGFVQEEIEKTAQNKRQNLQDKKSWLIGVNQYVNLKEDFKGKVPVADAVESNVKVLKLNRWAEEVEKGIFQQ